MFNTVEVIRNNDDFLTLSQKVIQFGAQDIILTGENCGGSSCGGPDHLSLIVLAPNKAPQVVTDKDFRGTVDDPEFREVNGTLIFPLGEQEKKDVQASWDGSSLTISKKKLSGIKELPDSECNNVYSIIVDDCATATSCDDPLGNASNVTLRSIPYNSAGFSDDGFNMACKKSCQIHKPASYEQFKLWACRSE